MTWFLLSLVATSIAANAAMVWQLFKTIGRLREAEDGKFSYAKLAHEKSNKLLSSEKREEELTAAINEKVEEVVRLNHALREASKYIEEIRTKAFEEKHGDIASLTNFYLDKLSKYRVP